MAMNRAKAKLVVGSARQWVLFGRPTTGMPSGLRKDITGESEEWRGKPEPRRTT